MIFNVDFSNFRRIFEIICNIVFLSILLSIIDWFILFFVIILLINRRYIKWILSFQNVIYNIGTWTFRLFNIRCHFHICMHSRRWSNYDITRNPLKFICLTFSNLASYFRFLIEQFISIHDWILSPKSLDFFDAAHNTNTINFFNSLRLLLNHFNNLCLFCSSIALLLTNFCLISHGLLNLLGG